MLVVSRFLVALGLTILSIACWVEPRTRTPSRREGPIRAIGALPVIQANKAAPYSGIRKATTLPSSKTPPTTDSELLGVSDLQRPDLEKFAISMTKQAARSHDHLFRGDLANFIDENGICRSYIPQTVLLKFSGEEHARGLPIKAGLEVAAMEELKKRPDVLFAELDLVLNRQFTPNDSRLKDQWHHAKIHSSDAWAVRLGNPEIKIAIVDLPFQMDHPDLAPNTISGWDVITGAPISSSAGDFHSTIGAGLAAAAVNNFVGVAGAGNFKVLPINIDPTISSMYTAILWAADNGVRVVNISYDGCFSSNLNDAGEYLQKTARGLLVMAGVNRQEFLGYVNQPAILAISMTDKADQQLSSHGQHVDFAAPGWQVFATTTNSTYESDSGTSYSAPLTAGVIASLLGINPELNPTNVVQILKETAVDLGTQGWDQFYGWGRIDFGKAARAAFATLPVSKITITQQADGIEVGAVLVPGAIYNLYRSSAPLPGQWEVLESAERRTNGTKLLFLDSTGPNPQAYYQLKVMLE